MSIFNKKDEKKKVEYLVATFSELETMTFDSDIDKYFKGDVSKLNDSEKSFFHHSSVINQLFKKVDLDNYEGKIDDDLFSIIKDLYYNLYLFVDGLTRLDEIVLGQARPSLLSRLEKAVKVYDYQMDVAGTNIEKLSKKMRSRVKELYPEIEV